MRSPWNTIRGSAALVRLLTRGSLGVLVLGLGMACNEDTLVTEPAEVVDRYKQEPGGPVDILWVVDDSGSMSDHQESLANGFRDFITPFLELELDFQMGVVTTDLRRPNRRGRFQGDFAGDEPNFLTSDTADLEARFRDTIRVGSDGAGCERGLEASRVALSEPLISQRNAGFLRPEAHLVVIYVSDEEDGSSPDVGSCKAPNDDFPHRSEADGDPWDYVGFLEDLKGSPERVSVFSIIGDPTHPDPAGNACAAYENDGIAWPGYRYGDATASAEHGAWYTICEEDFGPLLADMGDLISGLLTAFELSFRPLEGTIEVSVDGERLPAGDDTWRYRPDDNAIQFASGVVPECSDVRITYRTTEDTISEAPEAPEADDEDAPPGPGLEPCPGPPLGDYGMEGGTVSCAARIRPPASGGPAVLALGLLVAVAWMGRRKRS